MPEPVERVSHNNCAMPLCSVPGFSQFLVSKRELARLKPLQAALGCRRPKYVYMMKLSQVIVPYMHACLHMLRYAGCSDWC